MKRSFFAAILLLPAISCGSRRDPLPGFPRLVLWAWERPEQLDFIDPKLAGVAFLARTVGWRGGAVTSQPRYQKLRVPPGTALLAVIRMESWSPPLPALDVLDEAVRQSSALPGVKAIQIDFDARASERAWYRTVIERTRAQLPPSMPLTITALLSWCRGDDWIDGLPIDDAVPMLFRMGPGSHEFSGFRPSLCRSSVGISTDELPVSIPHGRRLFVFHPRPWTPDAYRDAIQLSRRWR